MTRSRLAAGGSIALLLVVTAVLILAIRAPAAWLGDWIEARTHTRLVDARGTIWHGSALLGFSNGRETTLVPGRLEWQVESVAASGISGRVSHPWLTAPLQLSLGRQAVGFAKGSARVPAGVLATAGAPFNTLRPGGTLEASWTDGMLLGNALKGEVQIDWRDARSALSTVAPLGSYRLRITGTGATPALDLQTLSGPLQMQGKGRIEGRRIRFNGTASAEAGMQPALNGLLGILGMRSGDKVLLAIDT
ncbi:MAG TPA: type II secretion system protein N [Burkholderiales bacterium]|nr:type II secretion system protein N [Burkholderiales bacterium]